MNMNQNERQEQPSVSRGQSHQPTKSRMVRKATRTVIRNDGHRLDVERGGQKVLHREHQIRIATWNVGSMSGRSGEVVDVLRRRRIDICCIQESRWRGSSARWMGIEGSRYKFFWQGRADGTGGIGILISEILANQLVNINRLNDRIMQIKVNVGKKILNVISAYAPQVGRPLEEKLAFWDDMHGVVSTIPTSQMMLIGGDLNGHVGRATAGYEEVHGGMGYGVRNQEGEFILEFADAMSLAVCNTFYRKPNRHLVTYQSGDNKTQIDYVLVRQSDRCLVRNVKVILGEECVTQHNLVCASLIIRNPQKIKKKKYVPRLRVWKLKEVNVQEKFEAAVLSKTEALQDTSRDPESLWRDGKTVFLNATEELCGWTKGRPSHRETWWWSDVVEDAVSLKRNLFAKWKRTGSYDDKREYQEAKRKARKVVWEAQEVKRVELADRMCKASHQGIFKIAKKMASNCSDSSTPMCIKDNGDTIVYGHDIVQVWKTYMESLLNKENEWSGIITSEPIEGPRCQLTEEEYENALKESKCEKAAGPTGVVSEMIVAAGKFGISWLTNLGNSILDENAIPKDWSISTVIPIFKGKGDPLKCSSYRAIKLLEQVMKIHERVLEKRIREIVDIRSLQFGFMPGRSTIDAIFVLRQLQERYLAFDKDLFFGFLDLEKAFDRVPRSVVQWALRKAGVDEWLVTAVMMLFHDARTVVMTDAGLSDSFRVNVGLHQGSVLSPLLFVLVMDVISKETSAALPWDVLYADDLAVVADSEERLKEKIVEWKRCLAEKGLRVNPSKSKVLISSAGATEVNATGKFPCVVCKQGVGSNSIKCNDCMQWVHRKCSAIKGSLQRASTTFKCKRCKGEMTTQAHPTSLNIDEDVIEVVSSFSYLGDELEAGGGADAAVNKRIRCGWAIFKALMPFLTSRAPSLRMKGRVYDACVRKGMIYGSETWAMKKDNEQRMERVEMRMIRWMSGTSLKDRKRNADLRMLFHLDSISDVMRRNRLRWFGHVMRKDPDDHVRQVRTWAVDGRKKRGRPRKTWYDSVVADLHQHNIKAEDVNDRQRWRTLIHRIGRNRPTLPSGNNGR